MNRNEMIPALPITRISVRLTSASVELFSDEIDSIHIMVSGGTNDVNALRMLEENDHLIVEQPAAARAKAPNAANWMQITIRVPRGWRGSVHARSVSGPITLRELSGADLSLDTVSGMITGSDLYFLSASARAITGDVRLAGLACDKCSLASTTGNLLLNGCSLMTCSANSVTGTIALSLTQPFTELSMNSVSGDLCVDAPIEACDALLRSVSGRVRTSGVSIVEDAAKIRAVTVASDLDISRNDLPEE